MRRNFCLSRTTIYEIPCVLVAVGAILATFNTLRMSSAGTGLF